MILYYLKIHRYKDDAYDRIWVPIPSENAGILSTTQDVVENSYKVPSAVLSTAVTPLPFQLTPGNISDKYYIYLHFAEVEELLGTQTREFNIYINDNLFYGPLSPAYLSTTTIFTLSPGYGSERYDVVINKTATSTLSPLINAVEIYIEM